MTIKEMRGLLGLSQAAFGEKYGIPKRSVENWERGIRQCPDYVLRLLEQSVLRDGGRVMRIYEYQISDGDMGLNVHHTYKSMPITGEPSFWELEVALPDGVESYETVTGETVIEYKGMPNPISQCLLPHQTPPTLKLVDEYGNDVYYALKVLSRREVSTVRTID